MGPRRLLKEGVVFKAKSGKKLNAFLCSDILVLLDEAMKNLYRMVSSSAPSSLEYPPITPRSRYLLHMLKSKNLGRGVCCRFF